jgi:hypothetical protein
MARLGDFYPEILARSRQVSRDRRHSRSFSPFSSGLGSSRRISIILSLVSWSRVHHCPSPYPAPTQQDQLLNPTLQSLPATHPTTSDPMASGIPLSRHHRAGRHRGTAPPSATTTTPVNISSSAPPAVESNPINTVALPPSTIATDPISTLESPVPTPIMQRTPIPTGGSPSEALPAGWRWHQCSQSSTPSAWK